MAEFAALPLFTDSLLADTGHLSHEEFGLYMRVLILMWRSPDCKIPNDKNWLSKRLNVDPLRCDAVVMPIMREFCKTTGNWWTQKRLLKEFIKRRDFSEQQSERRASSNHPHPVDKSSDSDRDLKDIDSHVNRKLTNLPIPKVKIRTPLTPQNQKPVSSPGQSGSFKRVGMVGSGQGFDVAPYLRDNDYREMLVLAPGWDRNKLIETYNAWVAKNPPDKPRAAFIGWLKRFTKGKRP